MTVDMSAMSHCRHAVKASLPFHTRFHFKYGNSLRITSFTLYFLIYQTHNENYVEELYLAWQQRSCVVYPWPMEKVCLDHVTLTLFPIAVLYYVFPVVGYIWTAPEIRYIFVHCALISLFHRISFVSAVGCFVNVRFQVECEALNSSL